MVVYRNAFRMPGRTVTATAGPEVPVSTPRREPFFLAGPPLFWRLLAANLFVVLGGAVIGTTLTRQFVMRGAFTPVTHALMVLAAIGLSALLTAVILHIAFRPLRALRQEIERSDGRHRPSTVLIRGIDRFGDPDILAVATAVDSLWDRLDQYVRLLEESNQRLQAQRRELAEKTVQLEQVATLVMAAQEEERRRVARELHDDTMQSMAALIMGLERGLQAMPADVPHLRAAHHTTAHLRDLAIRMLDDLRHLALDLRPAVLDDHGLEAALRWLVESHQERYGLAVTFTYRNALEQSPEPQLTRRLPPQIETAIFRIAQEALSNVAKHSGAHHAWVRLHQERDHVTVEIEDDGVGLPHDRRTSFGHMGMLNMRERAALLGGTCRFLTGGGDAGTLVYAVVPVDGGAANASILSLAAASVSAAHFTQSSASSQSQENEPASIAVARRLAGRQTHTVNVGTP
jgi:two-component system, NarL family, sensor histidine kinase UhpB